MNKYNNSICKKFNIPASKNLFATWFGFLVKVESYYPNLCDGRNLKKLIKLINKHKITHKLEYNGDTNFFFVKLYKMRLSKKVLDAVREEAPSIKWRY